MKKTIIVAICGASGSIYGMRTLKALLAMPVNVRAVISNAGRQVLSHECGYAGGDFSEFLKHQGIERHAEALLEVYAADNLFAPPASGSFRHDGMIIAPCSMKTLAAIASGIADDLIHRAADVCLKERYPLVLLTRETPLNLIHIENMRTATLAGATIMPPCPGFYHHPQTITDIVDATVARALDQMNIRTDLMKRWGEDEDV